MIMAEKFVLYNPEKDTFIGHRTYAYGRGSYANEALSLKTARVFTRPQDAAYQWIEGFELRKVHLTMEEGPHESSN